jgi:hypothetical protein
VSSKPRPIREPEITDTERAHWAFQPPRQVRPPQVRNTGRVRTPIDAFLLARLEKVGLSFAPATDRATLLRRVTFDLTGLPPTPREQDDFLADRRPGAFGRVVERLLASPHYGERWGQHWLDVVRFAESNGYELDAERPHAWRYRDYVIRSLNEDRPYDRFVREQLAGDELAASGRGERTRELIAAGFNRCGPVHLVSGNTDPEVNRQEVLTEMTGAVGATFLGLTVGCARCHNHKFDPISQADYYRLQAFFAAAQPREVDISTPEERRQYQARFQALCRKLEPLRQKVNALDVPIQKRLMQAKKARLEPAYKEALATPPQKRTARQRQLAADAEPMIKVTWDEILAELTPAQRRQRAAWRAQIHALETRLPFPVAHAWTIRNEAKTPPTYLLQRGDVKRKGARVFPNFLRVLRDRKGRPRSAPPTRLDLARWLTRPDHPLTARVLVNRLWQHHFGKGLVATPNDFGFNGAAPTHPELLDWLAREFTTHGWSIKHMHRLIVRSAAYRQAGLAGVRKRAASARGGPSDPAVLKAKRLDPDNHLLWHMPRQRLSGEALRDSSLAAAGWLNPNLGGPMIRVPLEPEVYELIFTEGERDGLWPVNPDVRQHRRRSVYLFNKRNVRLPLLEAFDKPDTLTSCPIRPVSTFAPQALILINGDFMQKQSRQFASRLLRECGARVESQIKRAYRVALSRPPRQAERALVRTFLTSQTALLRDRLRARQSVALPHQVPPGVEPAAAAALVDFCLALLNCNEFIYIN